MARPEQCLQLHMKRLRVSVWPHFQNVICVCVCYAHTSWAAMRDTPRFPVVYPPVSLQSRHRRQRWRRKMGTVTRRWDRWYRCGPNTGAGRRATRSDSGPRFCTGSDWPVQVKTKAQRENTPFAQWVFRFTQKLHFCCFFVLFFCLSLDWNLITEQDAQRSRGNQIGVESSGNLATQR